MEKVAVILAVGLSVVSCSQKDAAPSVETPERQFVLDGVRIEQRDGERIAWVATAERTDGDMSQAQAANVVVDFPTDGHRPAFKVLAPRGELGMDSGVSTFEQVRIVDEAGGTVDAGKALYEQKADRLSLDGPLHFSAQGMSAVANKATVDLKTGTVNIDGPVTGRYTPQAKAKGTSGAR